MKPTALFSRISMLSLFVGLSAGIISAQSYYDDDIYYDASKAKRKRLKRKRRNVTSRIPAGLRPHSPHSSTMTGRHMCLGIM